MTEKIDTEAVLPRYAVVDRCANGHLRILRESGTEQEAVQHVRLLRWAGSPAYIVLLTAVLGDAAREPHPVEDSK